MNGTRYTLGDGDRFIKHGGRSILPIGSHFVPASGPDWPWRVGAGEFDAAFADMAKAGLNTVRIDLIWAAIEPAPGDYDEDHLAVIDEIFDSAEKYGLSLHPTLFVGGEVGDAYWDLPWATGRNPHTDQELLEYQVRHAGHLAARWKDRASLIAWDLTDEPPFWPYGSQTTDDDARSWTSAIVEALRAEDPHHLITIGTASQEIDHGPFRSDVTAPLLDFCTVHPYPIYSPGLYPDSLLSPRMTLAAAFETALAAGAGKPVMMHEYGASSTQFSEDQIAKFDRLSTWGSFGSGSMGFYSWCWTDAERSAFRRAPYVRMPHETQFGMTTASGAPRERLGVMTAMTEIVASLDLDGRASFGPTINASMPVPHEFVRPFDSAAFGLDDAPSGMYTPSELAWRPDRNADVLVKGWLNSFVLARRAGLSVEFERERLDGQWPRRALVLAPAPLTSTSNSLVHLRTSTLSGVSELHNQGRSLYLSCNAESAIPELQEIAGVRIRDRAPVVSEIGMTMVDDFGGLTAGTRMVFRGFSDDPMLRGVLLDMDDAEILAVDDSQNAVLTRTRVAAGQTILCAYPIELGLAAQADAFGPDDDSWMLYAAIGKESRALSASGTHDPNVACYELNGPSGGILIAANHGPELSHTTIGLPDGHSELSIMTPEGPESTLEGDQLSVHPHSVAVLTWALPVAPAEKP